MSLRICNTPTNKDNRQSKLVGTIKCQFKLDGLVRTDTEAKRQLIEKRLSQRFKDMNMFCATARSPLSVNVNKETKHVCFIVDIKVYHINEHENAELAAARWFVKVGRIIPKIILGSSTWAAEYAGLSTNIIPSYLFALEDALGLNEIQQVSAG
ncbi:MAG: hypothetical protein ACI9OH_000259 [Oleispira sp.]|jgi:hypothetical protein